jgi:hypothetical protein
MLMPDSNPSWIRAEILGVLLAAVSPIIVFVALWDVGRDWLVSIFGRGHSNRCVKRKKAVYAFGEL